MDENDQNPNPLAGMSPGEAFAYCLTDRGLAWLGSLLDGGRYELHAPEEAALLVVAWLSRAGDSAAASGLVGELRPHAHEVRFAPHAALLPVPAPDAVHRRTVGEASALLARRGPHRAVEAQREALTVWRPFEAELLAHRLRADTCGPAWRADGAVLLERYRSLAAAHTRCTRHLDPKSNAAILRHALEEAVAGRALPPRAAGLLRHAVTSAAAKRDRSWQPDRPSHHELTALVLRRLSAFPVDRGVPDLGPLTGPVTAEEAREGGLPVGTALPASVCAVVDSTLDAPLDVLLERGTFPSAETLAEAAEQFLALHTVAGYADASLRTVMAAMYRTRRGHRYPWDRERHARLTDAPWVRALGRRNPDQAAAARHALRTLGELAVRAFPGAGLPNRLALSLTDLAARAGLPADAGLLTEPFADAHKARLSPEVLPAARTAAELLRGTPYERLHGIDYAAVRDLAVAGDEAGFARLCAERAGRPSESCTQDVRALASDPAVIEQARILTTFNMAVLVRHLGIAPQEGWGALARGAFAEAVRPGTTPVRAARARRQALFHLSLCDAAEQTSVLAWIDAESARAGTAGLTSWGTRPSPRACRP
uniref:Uncharacterized protein n=1 Tax=Streptomyces sp. NBC_00049 TaxID=2903617 RepID=A0AAU2JYV6_9ACTN